MSNLYYQIVPVCEGPEHQTLALSVDPLHPQGQVLVVDRVLSNPPDTQLWTPLVCTQVGDPPFGFVLVNKASGRILAWQHDNWEVVQHPNDDSVSPNAIWEIVSGPASLVVRLKSRPNQNLNVYRTPDNRWIVGTWDWSGGQDNEQWRFDFYLPAVPVRVAGGQPSPKRAVER